MKRFSKHPAPTSHYTLLESGKNMMHRNTQVEFYHRILGRTEWAILLTVKCSMQLLPCLTCSLAFQMLAVIECVAKCQHSLSDVTAYFCVFRNYSSAALRSCVRRKEGGLYNVVSYTQKATGDIFDHYLIPHCQKLAVF